MVEEPQSFAVERFQLSTSRDGVFNVESATLRSLYSWDLHLWLGDANDPLTLARVNASGEDERLGALVRTRFGGELGGSVVVLPMLALAVDLPMVLTQDRDGSIDGLSSMLGSIDSAGIGDLRVAGKLGILRRARSGVDLSLRAQVTLPTGDSTEYRGEDGLTFAPAALLSGRAGIVRWAAELGYLARPESRVAELRVDDEIRLSAGAAVRIAQPAELGATLAVATAADDLFGSKARNYSELMGGPAVEVGGQFVLFAAAGAGLQNGYGTPDWRALAGLRVGRLGAEVGGDEDPDRDGVDAADDRCPRQAEDLDGYQDTDGCPDDDNDGDGVADVADRAPMEAEDKDGFKDDDGVPDLDNDEDGILDASDKCPDQAEAKNGYQDDDGCPDEADGDGDGFADPRDTCPADAEDVDGYQDDDGCPEADNDKDGVADAADRCPLVAGVADNGGCPDTDRDGDGVVDRLVNCPDAKGQAKFSGCASAQLVSITGNQINLLDIVYFQTSRDRLQTRSFRLLDNVAAVINAHPEVTKLTIEGHTDAQGDEAKNQDLSQRRAEAVVAYLVKRGVAQQRLEAKGYGETRPVSDNATARGRGAPGWRRRGGRAGPSARPAPPSSAS
jgi:outer membrane protein OmpA-like peptidoglycan-associated protein